MTKLDFTEILQRYEAGESTYSIAQHYGTYPNKINRLLKKHGVSLKNKSDAQANALKQGRANHPTEGKERNEQERLKISASMSRVWAEMPEEERQRRSEVSKENWYSMSPDHRKELRKSAREAILRASKEGTAAEKFFVEKLEELGHRVILHDNYLLEGNLECDIHLPDLKVVVEIDGVQHRENIYGLDRLEMTKAFDDKKDKLLVDMEYSVIRIPYNTGTLYIHHVLFERFLSLLNQIIDNHNNDDMMNGQVYHLEVEDLNII